MIGSFGRQSVAQTINMINGRKNTALMLRRIADNRL